MSIIQYDSITNKPARNFHSLRIIVVVLLSTMMIPLWVNWYKDQVSLPRYCEDPQGYLLRLKRVMLEKRPAGEEARRSYIVAAKLLFLLPQQSEESVADYLTRIQTHIKETCRS